MFRIQWIPENTVRYHPTIGEEDVRTELHRDHFVIDLDDNAYLTLRTSGGVIGSMILSWTNYGVEENYTVLYCEKGTLAIGTDPVYGVQVEYRNYPDMVHGFITMGRILDTANAALADCAAALKKAWGT